MIFPFFYELSTTLFCLTVWIVILIGGGFVFGRKRLGIGQPYGKYSLWIMLFLLPVPYLIVKDASQQFHDELRRPLETFAPTYAYAMRAMGLESLSLDTSPDDPRYLAIVKAQKDWVSQNPLIADVYVFVRDAEGQIRFLVDSETDYDRDGVYEGERESRTEIGELYEADSDDDIVEAFEGRIEFNFDVTTDRWGQWLSANYPLKDVSGRVTHVIGVDFPAASYVSQRAHAHRQALILAMLFVTLVWAGALALGIRQFQLASMIGLKQKLSDSHEFAESVQRIARVGGWELEPGTGATRATSEVSRIYGLPEGSSGDIQKAISFYAPHEQARIAACVENCSNGKPYRETFEFVDAQGIKKWVEASGQPIFDKTGSVILLRGTFQDVTEKIEMQKTIELERAKSLHSSKLASLGEMSAGIAHEINNPLAVILGNLPLLRKFKEDEVKFNSKIDSIARSAHRIEKIVGGLRRFGRSSEGTLRKMECLRDIVSESLIIVEAKSKRHATPIEVDVAGDLQLLCDGVEIEQVLVNLVNNAIDAVKLQDEKWVKIHAFAEDSEIVIRVSDSGPGISTTIEEKLFEPFFTTKSVGEGTGLGLSITKGILDSHKASIRLDRSSAHTCFELRFARVDAKMDDASGGQDVV